MLGFPIPGKNWRSSCGSALPLKRIPEVIEVGKESRVAWVGALSVFAVVTVLIFAAWGIRYAMHVREDLEKEQQKKLLEARQQELYKVIAIVGTPLSDNPELPALDFNAEASRLLAIHRSNSLQFQDSKLTTAWSQIEVNTDQGLADLQAIAGIEQKMPSLVDAGADVLKSLNDLGNDDNGNRHPGDWNTVITYVQMLQDKTDKQTAFRSDEARLDSSLGDLRNVANDDFATSDNSGAVSVDYFPSWEGRYNGDIVTIVNRSGGELDHVPVFVTAHMKDGRTFSHVHYADRWPNGATFKAIYPSKSSPYANQQAIENPQSVEVAVYMPDGAVQTSYALTDSEWDKKLMQYCSGLTFQSEFLNTFSDPQGRGNHPGFKFQFHGLSSLPVEYVDIWFQWNNGTVRSVRVPFNLLLTDSGDAAGGALLPDQAYTYRGTEIEMTNPDGSVSIPDKQILYSIKIAGSGYVEQRQVYPSDSRVN